MLIKIWRIIKKKLNFFLSLINTLSQFDNREQEVLILNMPEWYSYYQYNFYFRCLRLIVMLMLCSTWYHTYILEIIKHICNQYNITLLQNLSLDKCLSGYSLMVMVCIFFLFVHCLFNALIRIYFLKKIVKNSPISFAQCISTGLRICRYSIGFTGLLLGIPGIDYVFEKNGQIPPLRGFYMKRQIDFFGANEVNCAITEGYKLPKKGIIRKSLSVLQDYTQNKEVIANTAYNNEKTTESVLNALKNK